MASPEKKKEKTVVHIPIQAEPRKSEVKKPNYIAVEEIQLEEGILNISSDEEGKAENPFDAENPSSIEQSADKFKNFNDDNLGESFDQEGLGSSLASEEQRKMGGFLKTLAKNNTMDREENSSRSNQFADVEAELEAMGFQGPGQDGEEDSEIEGMDNPDIILGVNIKQGFGGNLEGMDILSGLSPE